MILFVYVGNTTRLNFLNKMALYRKMQQNKI
jgi:hypothetical protein